MRSVWALRGLGGEDFDPHDVHTSVPTVHVENARAPRGLNAVTMVLGDHAAGSAA
jgi:hypothetical protein